jgi:hypothetical protein
MNNYNGGDEDDNIRTIEIMIETNNNKTPFPLTYSKIITSSKPDIEIPGQQLPYFAPHIKYPKAYLEGKAYSSLLKTFFDRTSFINNVVANGTPTTDYRDMNENIVLMLNLLFPNTCPQEHNITTSFDKNLKQQRNPYRGNNITKIKKMMYGEKSKHAKLSANETISEIIWINDVINEPLYSNFIQQVNDFESRRQKSLANYGNDINIINNKLSVALTDPKSDTYFTKEDFDSLKNQIFLFDEDVLVREMIGKLNEYMESLDDKKADFQTKLTDMVNYFVEDEIIDSISGASAFNNVFQFQISSTDEDLFKYIDLYSGDAQNASEIASKQSELVELTNELTAIKIELDKIRFNAGYNAVLYNYIESVKKTSDNKNLKYILDNYDNGYNTSNINIPGKNDNSAKKGWITTKINDMKTKVNKIIILDTELAHLKKTNPLFKWKNSAYNKSGSLDQIKKGLKSEIDKLKLDLWELFKKYNDFKRISGNPQLYAQYRDADRIIKELIADMQMIQKPGIVNISNKLQSTLDKITTLRRLNVSSNIIEQKLQKITQIMNEKMSLDLIHKYILSSPGIYYKYKEIKLDKSMKQLFDDELRKEKYSFFVNTVNNINKDLFQNIESMNPKFQKMLKDYLDNTSNDFYKNIVIKSYEIENPRKNNSVSIDDTFNISVFKNNVIYNKNDRNKYNAAYKINVYMEVILGNLDEKTMGELNCQYKDKNLITRFIELMNPVKTYKIVKREPFNVETAKTEIKKKKKAKEEKIQSVNNKSVKRNIVKKGGYTRRNRYK